MTLRFVFMLLGLSAALLGHLLIAAWLPVSDFVSMAQAIVQTRAPNTFLEIQFIYTTLPRSILAMLVGAGLAISGSVMQQMTRNRLASPLTLGISSGAWLALIVVNLTAPWLLASHSAVIAMLGATLATVVIWLSAGRLGMNGLPMVLIGMAIHILCSTLASALILLNEQSATPLFIWGAGDLTQTDWQWVHWLAPKLLAIPLILLIAPRTLTMLKLGEKAAMARGLTLVPTLIVMYALVLWLVGNTIAAVGVIGFISLLAPNLARLLGSKNAYEELMMSLVLGACLLLVADSSALLISRWSDSVIPTGTMTTILGAPFLVLLIQSKLQAQDYTPMTLPKQRPYLSHITMTTLLSLTLLILIGSLSFSPMLLADMIHWRWQWQWPDSHVLALRWPSLVAAASGGAGMALAGLILQRLIRNPLASPDVLGLTAGSAMAIILTSVLSGQAIHTIAPTVALTGSLAALMMIVFLGRRHHYAPGSLILTGLALTAAMEGVTQLTLAQGQDNVYSLINWLTGSTYHVHRSDALSLTAIVIPGLVCIYACRHWLTLLHIGDAMALARGLSIKHTRLLLLIFTTLLVASITAFVGPLSFVGLMAPQLASILGARTVAQQIIWAPLMGMQLMLLADWFGRTLVYPAQLPAGIIAALLGSGYLVYLMMQQQKQTRR